MIPEPPEEPPGNPPEDAAEAARDPVADLPPVDSIDAQTDLAPWLRAGVPAALRNAALRRKWLATPAIRDYVDPALDYAWDWNAAAAVPGATGRIAADAAQKMLRALTEPPPPDAPAADPRDNEAGGVDQPTAQAGRDEAGHPDRDTDTAPGRQQPAPQADLPAPADPAPRARRHGGALPRPRG